MKYFLVPFLFFMSCFAFGQNRQKIDSLIKSLNTEKTIDSAYYNNQLFDIYFYEIPDSANYYLDKAIKHSQGNKSKNTIKSYFKKIDYFFYKINTDSLHFFSKQLSSLIDSVADKSSYRKLLLAKSKIAINENKFEQSDSILENLLKIKAQV